MVVGEGPVRLEHRELGRVARVEVLVAEAPPELVDLLEPTDQESLQGEFDRDPQLELLVEVAGPGHERGRRRAARHGQEDRSFHLQESLPVEEGPNLSGEERADAEALADLGRRHEVEVTAADALLRVLKPMVLLRGRSDGLREHREGTCRDGGLSPPRLRRMPLGAHDVSRVQVGEPRSVRLLP